VGCQSQAAFQIAVLRARSKNVVLFFHDAKVESNFDVAGGLFKVGGGMSTKRNPLGWCGGEVKKSLQHPRFQRGPPPQY
jgi:hypothetical protein